MVKQLTRWLMGISMAASMGANAAVIDFTTETQEAKPNGYTVMGVQFFDTLQANLVVIDAGQKSIGNALGIFGDNPSILRMVFPGLSNFLAVSFGNDHPVFSDPGDVALLRLFLGGSQVGETTVELNRNDIMDQIITLAGINFDEATFTYASPALAPINLMKIVDNITFLPAQVPEPGSLVLVGMAIAGLALVRRRRIKA